MSYLWCIQVNNQNVTNLFILLLLIYQKKSPNEVFSCQFIKVIHYTQNHSDSLTVDLIWKLLLQIKFSYNNVCFNFAIWKMRNYTSVLLNSLSVFSDLLPVHTSCCWSACYLLPSCWTLVFWHSQWGSLLYWNHGSQSDKLLEPLLGLGGGSAPWWSGYDAGVSENCT